MPAHWKTIELAGHAVEVLAPGETRAAIGLLVLPDQGGRASHSEALTAALVQRGVLAVAPHGDRTWWLDLTEPAFDAALSPLQFLTGHVVPWIEERFDIATPHLRLLGWGVGGQGVLQLAYRRPRDYPAVAAIDPAIDFHELHGHDEVITALFPNREAARQQTAILRMQGLGWPRRQLLMADPAGFWFDGVDRLDMKLRSMGIPVEVDFEQTANGDGRRFFEQHAERAVAFLCSERATLPVLG
jgi:pimeloyl-ACP methyl ester carboxylesterase